MLSKNCHLFSVSCYGGMYRAISVISAEDQKAWIMCVRKRERRGWGAENYVNLCPGLKTTSFPQIISTCTSITMLSLYNRNILCYKADLGPNKTSNTTECDTFTFNLHDKKKKRLHLLHKGLHIAGVVAPPRPCVNPIRAGCKPDMCMCVCVWVFVCSDRVPCV